MKHSWRNTSGGAGAVYAVVGAVLAVGLVMGLQALGVPVGGMVETIDGWIQGALRSLGLIA